MHWCLEEKALYCCRVLSSWPHISSLSKSELEALRMLSAGLSNPLQAAVPPVFPHGGCSLRTVSLCRAVVLAAFIVCFTIYRAFHINCLNNECRATRPRSLG